jgi:hypothetical protein
MTLQQENCVALSVALHRLASHDLRRSPEGEGSILVRSCEGKQALDIGSFQYSCGNEKGLASLQGLDFLGLIWSPTWARTRDLRINRLALELPAKPHECSFFRGRACKTSRPCLPQKVLGRHDLKRWILEATQGQRSLILMHDDLPPKRAILRVSAPSRKAISDLEEPSRNRCALRGPVRRMPAQSSMGINLVPRRSQTKSGPAGGIDVACHRRAVGPGGGMRNAGQAN